MGVFHTDCGPGMFDICMGGIFCSEIGLEMFEFQHRGHLLMVFKLLRS